MWRLTFLCAFLVAGCESPPARQPAPVIHGALAPLLAKAPTTLANCLAEEISYAAPFWRAPYRTCSTKVGPLSEGLELDADTVAVQVYTTWQVDRAARDSAFAEALAATERVLGAGRACSGRKREWRQGDSLHAILQVTPEGDVGDLEASPRWKITRLARLGPLDPSTWGCQTSRPAI